MSIKWDHEDTWTYRDYRVPFTVEVSRHDGPASDAGCYDSTGPHRWAIYAYIYHDHPLFAKFDDTDRMWQEATGGIPFHCGCSYLRRHVNKEGKTTAFQVGCDYNHDGDWSYTQKGTKEDAWDVFGDAERLVEWLKEYPPTVQR